MLLSLFLRGFVSGLVIPRGIGWVLQTVISSTYTLSLSLSLSCDALFETFLESGKRLNLLVQVWGVCFWFNIVCCPRGSADDSLVVPSTCSLAALQPHRLAGLQACSLAASLPRSLAAFLSAWSVNIPKSCSCINNNVSWAKRLCSPIDVSRYDSTEIQALQFLVETS